jgi:hypothetical protein
VAFYIQFPKQPGNYEDENCTMKFNFMRIITGKKIYFFSRRIGNYSLPSSFAAPRLRSYNGFLSAL